MGNMSYEESKFDFLATLQCTPTKPAWELGDYVLSILINYSPHYNAPGFLGEMMSRRMVTETARRRANSRSPPITPPTMPAICPLDGLFDVSEQEELANQYIKSQTILNLGYLS